MGPADLVVRADAELGRGLLLRRQRQGIDLPASWKLQYWNGTAYVDVAGASGYPLAVNQYNHVTFTAVSTTRLRVLLQSGTASVGLLEVKAFGP